MNHDFRRAALISAVAFFVTLWLAVNYRFDVGMIYTAMVSIGLVVYLSAKKLGLEKILIGVDRNWGEDIALGVALGVGFILLNMIAPNITIGVPVLPMSVNDQYLVAGFVAPVAEEIAFRGVLLSIADKALPFMFATLVVSVVFSVYHLAAYGMAASGAFFGAFLFSVIACLVIKKTRSLIPVILMHSIFNLFLFYRLMFVGTLG